jgi:DNA-binding response OmpR family regulator
VIPDTQTLELSPPARAVLAVFADAGPRVVGRTELRRRAGLVGRSERRCDALIVELRRALGPDAIVTVRGRGWRWVM